MILDTGAPWNEISIGDKDRFKAHLRRASEAATRQLVTTNRVLAKNLGSHDSEVVSLWTLDHLLVAGHAVDDLSFQLGTFVNILGYPFLSQFGAVGFNFRTRQLLFYAKR